MSRERLKSYKGRWIFPASAVLTLVVRRADGVRLWWMGLI